MKCTIFGLILSTLFSFMPTPVFAATNPHIYPRTRTDGTPKTEEPRPKWVKILEVVLPFSMALGFAFAQSSLGSKGQSFNDGVGHTYLIIGAVLLIITLLIALTLFVERMVRVIKKSKVKNQK